MGPTIVVVQAGGRLPVRLLREGADCIVLAQHADEPLLNARERLEHIVQRLAPPYQCILVCRPVASETECRERARLAQVLLEAVREAPDAKLILYAVDPSLRPLLLDLAGELTVSLRRGSASISVVVHPSSPGAEARRPSVPRLRVRGNLSATVTQLRRV